MLSTAFWNSSAVESKEFTTMRTAWDCLSSLKLTPWAARPKDMSSKRSVERNSPAEVSTANFAFGSRSLS